MDDLDRLKRLVTFMRAQGIQELSLNGGGAGSVHIVLQSDGGASPCTSAPADTVQDPATESSERPAKGRKFDAPIAGTFYRAPDPQADPFVAAGQRVEVGDVLCIIESMKMINRIKAEWAGSILALHVADGEPVDAGQPLFTIG